MVILDPIHPSQDWAEFLNTLLTGMRSVAIPVSVDISVSMPLLIITHSWKIECDYKQTSLYRLVIHCRPWNYTRATQRQRSTSGSSLLARRVSSLQFLGPSLLPAARYAKLSLVPKQSHLRLFAIFSLFSPGKYCTGNSALYIIQ